MKRKVVQIDEYEARRKRASRSAACYCAAVRAADEQMAREMADLRRHEAQAAVLRLQSLEGGVPARAGGWDLIVSSDVFANLPNVAARQVIKAAMACLKPGGRLLLSNVSAEALVGQCGECVVSGKVGRTERDMVELAAAIPAETAGGQLVYRDYPGLNVYLELYKNAGGGKTSHQLSSQQLSSRQLSSRQLKPVLQLERVICPAV